MHNRIFDDVKKCQDIILMENHMQIIIPILQKDIKFYQRLSLVNFLLYFFRIFKILYFYKHILFGNSEKTFKVALDNLSPL